MPAAVSFFKRRTAGSRLNRFAMKPKLSFRQLFTLNAYWIGLSFMWNAIHPIMLPAILLKFVPETQKNTDLGLLSFIGLTIALFMQPLAGALSDGWASRWGRRRPLMLAGTLLDFVFLAVLGWAGGLVWLFIGYVGLQLSSNLAQGALQGLLPDQVSKTQMGSAAAVKTFMDVASLILASLVAGRLLNPATRNASLVTLAIGVTLALGASITLLGVHEEPTHERARPTWRSLREHVRIDLRENPSYWWLTAERALFLLGIYGVQAFAEYYLQDVLQVPNPVKATGDLLAVISLGVILLVLAGGWLTDRFGARPISLVGSLLAPAGLLLMLLAHNLITLTIFAAVLGAGIGLFLTSNWALANILAPDGQAGKYLGLMNLATAGSGALARLEGPLIDLLNHAHPAHWDGYTAMFLFGAFCTLASVFLLNRVKIKQL